MRRPKKRIGRPVRGSQRHQAIDQFSIADRRAPDSRSARPCRGRSGERESTARCRAEPKIGRFAVDQESRFRRDLVRRLGAVAAPLFAGDEQQSYPSLSGGADALGRRDLSREDAFRVARAAPIELPAFDAAGKNGGTQSKWVEKTTSGSPMAAIT